jgi:predicted nuclease with TOPRIM domain
MTEKQIIKSLKIRQKELAKTRDGLRELESEIGQLRETADDALDSLNYAIDRLSELV